MRTPGGASFATLPTSTPSLCIRFVRSPIAGLACTKYLRRGIFGAVRNACKSGSHTRAGDDQRSDSHIRSLIAVRCARCSGRPAGQTLCAATSGQPAAALEAVHRGFSAPRDCLRQRSQPLRVPLHAMTLHSRTCLAPHLLRLASLASARLARSPRLVRLRGTPACAW